MADVGFDWSPANVDRLKLWLTQDISAAEIAGRFGSGLTRSAVLGKVNRLGLSLPTGTRWTPEREVILREAIAVGMSAAEAAAKLNTTRNSVLTKAGRLGLGFSRYQPQRRAEPPRLATVDGARLPRASVQTPPVEMAKAPRLWTTRRFGECAFPVDGEGADVRSCCNPTACQTYCTAHKALMHIKPSKNWAEFDKPHFARKVA